MAGGLGATRLRLRPSVEVFQASTGELYLMAAGEPHRVVRQPDPADTVIVKRLEGSNASKHELAALLVEEGLDVSDEALAGKLAALLRSGLAREEPATELALDPRDRERFDRQLPYFAEWAEPASAQWSLRRSRVVVLGCGGLGTWVLGALASAGVGGFVLIDDDRIELSNLNRQILYTEADVGDSKVAAAAGWVRRFDASIDVRAVRRFVRGADDLAPLLAGASVLVQAADQPAYDIVRWANSACVRARVPFVTAGQYPPMLKVGPTYVPGETACFECHERALRAEFPLYEELAGERQDRTLGATTLGPASGLIGTMVALEVVHLLTGFRPLATQGRTLLLNMQTLHTSWEPVERDPSCPRCRHLPPIG